MRPRVIQAKKKPRWIRRSSGGDDECKSVFFFCGSGPESHQQVLGFPRNINYKTLFKRSCDDAFSSIWDHKAVQLQRDHRDLHQAFPTKQQSHFATCYLSYWKVVSVANSNLLSLLLLLLNFFYIQQKSMRRVNRKKNKCHARLRSSRLGLRRFHLDCQEFL